MITIGDRAVIDPRIKLVLSQQPIRLFFRPYSKVEHIPLILVHNAWIGIGVNYISIFMN